MSDQHWTVYLSGEIHIDWREEIRAGAEAADLPVSFVSAVTDHGASDDCGVVVALMNAHVEMARQDPAQRITCPPRILSVEEGRRVFNQWADITPAAEDMPFPELVMTALTTRYPCSAFRGPKRRR